VFFVLSKILDILLSPFTWGLIFVLLSIPWRTPRPGRWKRRRAFALIGVGVLLVFALEPVSNSMMYRLERKVPPTYKDDVVYDVVILLGGVGDERVEAETGQPAYNDDVERLVATHRLLADNRARFAIVSGAAEHPSLIEHGEARMLGRQIALWGVDPSRVIIEEKARNTRENAVYSEQIVRERGFEKVLIVTSAFHMRRSLECFNAVGLRVDTYPVDYRAHSDKTPGSDSLLPRTHFLADSTKTLHEMAGLYIYRARGYAKPSLE
jgi:uncharacterized SAM-binding protein YcdF (DUF218 family)